MMQQLKQQLLQQRYHQGLQTAVLLLDYISSAFTSPCTQVCYLNAT